MARINQTPARQDGPGVLVQVIDASASNLADLSDVAVTSPVAGDALRYQANGTWANQAVSGGSGGVDDGTYGDVVVSGGGTTWAVGNDSHTHSSSTVTPSGIGAATSAHSHTGEYQPVDTVIRQYIPAGSMWPTVTSGCNGPSKLESATNKSNRLVLGFPTGSTTRAEFEIGAPSNWDGGTWTAEFDWETDAGTSASVTWALAGRVFRDGDASDAAVGTAKTVSDAASGTAYQKRVSAATAAVTLAGSPVPGATRQALHFRISRNGAADTLDGNAYLHGIWLTGTHT